MDLPLIKPRTIAANHEFFIAIPQGVQQDVNPANPDQQLPPQQIIPPVKLTDE